jgi:hypothetical protein
MNRNALNIFEKRVDKLAILVKPRSSKLIKKSRIDEVVVALTVYDAEFRSVNRNTRIGVVTKIINIVQQHQIELDGFEQKEFENRVCRLRRALNALTLGTHLNPLLVPLESRLHYLFFNPPKWFLRGPIVRGPWGIVEVDGKRYDALVSTSNWTEKDLATWEVKRRIIEAARERVPQMLGRNLHQKYFYAEYFTSEEQAVLAELPELPKQRIYWPGPSGEEISH